MKFSEFNDQIQKYLKQQLSDENGWIKYTQKNPFQDSSVNIFLYPMNCFHAYPEQLISKCPDIIKDDSRSFKKGSPDMLGLYSTFICERENISPLILCKLYCYYNNVPCGKSASIYDTPENRYRFMNEGLTKFSEMINLFCLEHENMKFNIGMLMMLDAPQNGMDPNRLFNLVFNSFFELKKNVNLILINYA